jgi:hypothetical protein
MGGNWINRKECVVKWRMKLNGHTYLKRDPVTDIIEDIIILLEMGSYYEISDAISNIKPENADNVAKKLAQFQDMFSAYFETESYCKLDTALEMTEENKYDPHKEKVSLFSHGAYGITVRADDDSAERYIFNVCLQVFMSKLKKINND